MLIDWPPFHLRLHLFPLDDLLLVLPLGLGLVRVLVSDGEGLLGHGLLCNRALVATAASLSGTAAAAAIPGVAEHGHESGEFVHGFALAPCVEVVIGEDPVEFVAGVGSDDRVGHVDNVTTIVDAASKSAVSALGCGLPWLGELHTEIGSVLAFLEGDAVRLSPWGLAAPADSADTADDLLVDLEVEWWGFKVRVLDLPGEAVSENAGHVVVCAEAVLALHIGVSERRARSRDVPGKEGVLAVGKSSNDISLARSGVADSGAL